MDASTYPITTGYGQIPGYPLNNGFHKGEDRAMPVGTPVKVNGVQIGLSGNTGASTGPHLHIGKFVNGVVQPPNGAGFSLNNASVYDTGYDATNGNFVRISSDLGLFVYLHLSRIDVVKGQILKGDKMVDKNLLNNLYMACFGRNPFNNATGRWDDPSAQGWLGQPVDLVLQKLLESPEHGAYVASKSLSKDSVLEYVKNNLK